ncbi:MAG: TolC family protein [Syntrophales bacterium]
MNATQTTSKLTASRIAVIFGLLLCMTGVGNTADREQRYSLSQAVRAALENNHELKAQRNAAAAKQEEIGVARSFLLPKIFLEERYLRTVNPGYAFMAKLDQQRIAAGDFIPDTLNHPDAVNDFQSTISIEQPLFMRKAAIGLEMSKGESRAAAEDLGRKKEETAFKAVQSYLMVGTAAAFIKVAEKAGEDAQEHRRTAELRYKNGLGLYSDLLRANTAVADAQQQLVSAEKDLAVAKRALGLILGLASAVDVTEMPPPLPLRDPDYYREQALARRDIKVLALRTENAKKNVKLAAAAYFPTLGVGGAYQLNDHSAPLGAEGDNWQLTAFLKWEAFDGRKMVHERRKAEYEAAATEEYLEGLKKMIFFRVQEAYLTIEETAKNRKLAEEAVQAAEEGRRLVRVRYEGSLSPLVDLLDAQVSIDHARANLVAKENDYRLAIARLSYESGTILSDLQVE